MRIHRRQWLLGALAGLAVPARARAQASPAPAASGATASGATAAGATAAGEPLRKKVPSTGEALPVIGIGTARKYHNPSTNDFAILHNTVQRFAEAGGSVIDTAPAYGTAEGAVGLLIQTVAPRERFFLATKVGATGREEGKAQIERSFRQLRTERIDLIAVHNLRDAGTQLPTLRELKSGGRIRHVGITTSSDSQYEEFEQTMKREALDFVQVDYALNNRGAAERILPLALDRGMAVMVNLPFGRGSLFRAVQGKSLPGWASEIDCTSWAQVFLKYVVSHEAVVCAIPGTSKPEHAVDNAGAARGRMPDAAMRRRMEAFVDAL